MNQHLNPRLHKPVSRFYVVLISLMIIAGLSACGGGGGNSNRPSLSIDSLDVDEGQSGDTAQLVFTITLSEDAGETLTLDYTTADGTATAADNDFVTASGQVTIPQGSQTANISITINGDDDFEQNETFNLELSNPQGIALSENSISGSGLINNDDDADPKGYFAGTGTFNGTDYTDVTALVYDKRILLFSPTANVQYDIVITPTVFDYDGTVEVYVDGQIEQENAVTVSGTSNELQIAGTFAGGTGFGTGSFDVAFDVDNNEGASFPRVEGTGLFQWTGDYFGRDEDTGFFDVDNTGAYIARDDSIERCVIGDDFSSILIRPNPDINIFQMAHDITASGTVGTCTSGNYAGTGHDGFVAVINDTAADDKLLFAFNNDDIALFGILNETVLP